VNSSSCALDTGETFQLVWLSPVVPSKGVNRNRLLCRTGFSHPRRRVQRAARGLSASDGPLPQPFRNRRSSSVALPTPLPACQQPLQSARSARAARMAFKRPMLSHRAHPKAAATVPEVSAVSFPFAAPALHHDGAVLLKSEHRDPLCCGAGCPESGSLGLPSHDGGPPGGRRGCQVRSSGPALRQCA
jgi:hypothetical protein